MFRALRNRSGRALAHLMVLLGLGACVLALVGVRTVGAQADPTEPPTTAAVATTAAPSTSAAPALEERVSESEQATTRLNRVIIGLVALAVVIAIATVVFWRLTRPRSARAGGSAAYWVDGEGVEVPLPASQRDGVGQGAVAAGAAGAAFGASAPDPDAWSVGPPPTIPSDGAQDVDAHPDAEAPLSPLPARTPGAGPYPGRNDDLPRPGAPVVIVEPVQAPRPTAGWSDDLRSDGDGEPDPPEPSEGWASQGWGTGDEEHPDDR